MTTKDHLRRLKMIAEKKIEEQNSIMEGQNDSNVINFASGELAAYLTMIVEINKMSMEITKKEIKEIKIDLMYE